MRLSNGGNREGQADSTGKNIAWDTALTATVHTVEKIFARALHSSSTTTRSDINGRGQCVQLISEREGSGEVLAGPAHAI